MIHTTLSDINASVVARRLDFGKKCTNLKAKMGLLKGKKELNLQESDKWLQAITD